MSTFDFTVIGAGIGGLATAARLARLKKKALIIVQGNEAGGVFIPCKADGYQFAAGPAMSFDFERAGTIRQLYTDLGIAHNAAMVSPCYQVALPNHRITVSAEHRETIDEMSREFPREIDSVYQFYRDIKKSAERSVKSRVASYFAKHKRSGAFLRRYRFSRELSAFFDVQARYFFCQPINDLPLSSLIALIDSSPLHVAHGFKKVADQLLEVILKNNGVVLFAEPFPELVQRRGRVAELITSNRSVKPGSVLLNTKLPGRATTVCMGISNQVVPVRMIHEVICLSDYDRPQGMFSLSLSKPDDELSAPKGLRALTVRFPSASVPEKEALLALVGTIMPFVGDYCETVHRAAADGMQYLTPDSLFVTKDKIERQGDRGTIKNMFFINDDDCCPEQAVAAAQRIAKRLA